MASSDSMSFSGLLECSICMEDLSEDNLPRTLPCTHVYCTVCLSKLAKDHGGQIKCPDCRVEHVIIEVEELGICLTTMKLRAIKQFKLKKRDAEHEKQRSDGSDSVSTASGKTKSASQTSGSEIEEPLPSFMALMHRASQSIAEASHSGKNLELAINETRGRRDTLLQTMESAMKTIEDWMKKIERAATERKKQLLEILEDTFHESMSPLTAMEKNFEARQESLQIFCKKMVQAAASLQGHDQADPEEIDKLIKENQDSINDFKDKILIRITELSLDTDDDKNRSILGDVSSWGGINTKVVTLEVPPIHPQPSIAAMTQHYLAKTEAMHIIDRRTDTDLKRPFGVSQLPNGDIAIGMNNGPQIRIYDSDLKPKRVLSLPTENRSMWAQGITGMCVTPNGKLCISDPGMKTVHVVTPEGRLESSFNTCLPPLEKDFYPRGLASMKWLQGEVFVCDWNNHVIRVFDQGGQECGKFGGFGEEPGKLRNPHDLAVTPDDSKVLVADTENNRIQVFNGATGSYQATFGSRGSGPYQLDKPVAIAIDSMGFVAVAEENNHRVQLFTPRWESLHILQSQEDPFYYPRAMIFTNGNEVVVCDYCNNMIHFF